MQGDSRPQRSCCQDAAPGTPAWIQTWKANKRHSTLNNREKSKNSYITKIENRSRDLSTMTRRGSENSHEDEEGGGRALGLAARGGLLALAGAAAGPEPTTTTTAQKLNRPQPSQTIVPPQDDQRKARRSYLPSSFLEVSALPFMVSGWS